MATGQYDDILIECVKIIRVRTVKSHERDYMIACFIFFCVCESATDGPAAGVPGPGC